MSKKKQKQKDHTQVVDAGRFEPTPGLYRARVEMCVAERGRGDTWGVEFEFGIRAPVDIGRRFSLWIDTCDGGGDLLCRVFSVLGVAVEDEGDLALACREVVGRHAYVQVLEDGTIHVQQLATTQAVADPVAYDQSFPKPLDDEMDDEGGGFHKCDTALKAAYRIHPEEQIRAIRTAQES